MYNTFLKTGFILTKLCVSELLPLSQDGWSSTVGSHLSVQSLVKIVTNLQKRVIHLQKFIYFKISFHELTSQNYISLSPCSTLPLSALLLLSSSFFWSFLFVFTPSLLFFIALSILFFFPFTSLLFFLDQPFPVYRGSIGFSQTLI